MTPGDFNGQRLQGHSRHVVVRFSVVAFIEATFVPRGKIDPKLQLSRLVNFGCP